jgi:hypothetical protein
MEVDRELYDSLPQIEPILCPSINNCLENMKKNATLESDFWDENYKLQDSVRITLIRTSIYCRGTRGSSLWL